MIFDDKKNLKTASLNRALLTPKHAPNYLATTYNSFRTVISHDLANNLETFISSGNYTLRELENTRGPNSPQYFEITTNQNSSFNVPACGVTETSIFSISVVGKIVVDQDCLKVGIYSEKTAL